MTEPAADPAHLNLVASSARLFELDPGARLERGDGSLLAAGTSSHPLISNAAFRTDDRHDPAELLGAARAFFAARGHGFSVWTRSTGADADLAGAAEAAGLHVAYESPAMVLEGRPRGRPAADGVEIAPVASAADAADFWQVAVASYADIGFPPEVFAHYERHEGLWADDVATFLGRREGEPVGISMSIVSHGIAGIYWIGAAAAARGNGVGRAMTVAAIEAGRERGGEVASLQASPMGEGLYRDMGFETIYSYRLHLSPAA